ncbi:MAG: Gfo/Idh/MocA family oxidoreductase, partial [Clostridiales bacterium]|nr:Gfo/Idh/MocA family oxidoreductase [Candidatus Blautia equi]
LGSALQTVRKAVHDGLIGEVTGFQAYATRDLNFLASLFKFLRMPGGGICYDYGVYYLTALVSTLGPVDRVAAVVQNKAEKRINTVPDSPEFGQKFDYLNESMVHAVMQLKSGVAGTFALNGDANLNDLAYFHIFGTKGTLKLTDPNGFGGDVVYVPNPLTGEKERVLENTFAYSENSRGVGASEMADAILTGRKNRAAKEMAFHVLDTIDKIMKSSESGAFEKVESTFTLPDPFTDGRKLMEK